MTYKKDENDAVRMGKDDVPDLESTEKVVLDLFNDIRVDFYANDISIAHRLPTKPEDKAK